MRAREERLVGGLRCGEVLAVLSEFHDGELETEKRQLITGHLRGCDWCEQFGGRFSEMVRSLRRELAEPAPLSNEVAARLRTHLNTR